MVMLALSMPLIWTKRDVVPCELVIVHAGPGETQPGGVGPGVSQRFASPAELVMPGVKGLELKDEEPVWLCVISEILTMRGVQLTSGFQDDEVA